MMVEDYVIEAFVKEMRQFSKHEALVAGVKLKAIKIGETHHVEFTPASWRGGKVCTCIIGLSVPERVVVVQFRSNLEEIHKYMTEEERKEAYDSDQTNRVQ